MQFLRSLFKPGPRKNVACIAILLTEPLRRFIEVNSERNGFTVLFCETVDQVVETATRFDAAVVVTTKVFPQLEELTYRLRAEAKHANVMVFPAAFDGDFPDSNFPDFPGPTGAAVIMPLDR
jgi:hypothetical protein